MALGELIRREINGISQTDWNRLSFC